MPKVEPNEWDKVSSALNVWHVTEPVEEYCGGIVVLLKYCEDAYPREYMAEWHKSEDSSPEHHDVGGYFTYFAFDDQHEARLADILGWQYSEESATYAAMVKKDA